MAWMRLWLARIWGFLRPGHADREFAEELEIHLALAEEEKIRQGLDPKEARRQARIELGGMTQLLEAGRDARGLPSLDNFWLDLKLSLRMLRKSWGLTLVGGLAMTLVIVIGVVVFWFLEQAFSPTLPLAEGERVVSIQTWDRLNRRPYPTTVEDVERWRDTLRSVVDFGVFRRVDRNLKLGEGPAERVRVAEMTASGFQLARISPSLGRPLVQADELEGADPVVVIGDRVWRARFAADPNVLGRTLWLSGVEHTVVGVMPEGYAFPVSDQFWVPFQWSAIGHGTELDPDQATAFARLGKGVALESTKAEVRALGLLPTHRFTGSEEPDLTARVVPYALAFDAHSEPGKIPWEARLMLVLILLLLVPPSANIAILVYARTLSRQGELAARFVLGAGRRRLVGQLFLEVLVLSSGAAVLAVILASAGGVYLRAMLEQESRDGIPFWVDFSLSAQAMVFAGLLALVAALVAGLVPALKATGRQAQSGFHSLGNRIDLPLGRTWTALVVIQVALCLSVLPTAVEMGWGTVRKGVLGPGFAAETYLTAELSLDRDQLERGSAQGAAPGERTAAPFESRFGALQSEWIRQMSAESGVLGITAALSPPGEEPWVDVELEPVELADGQVSAASHRLVRLNRVDRQFFDVFQIPVLAGRSFQAGDFDGSVKAVVVNQAFADQWADEGSPLGRRVRTTRFIHEDSPKPGETSSWVEIVGVVADRPAHATHGTMYQPAAVGQIYPLSVSIRAGLDPSRLSDRARELTEAVNPALRVERILPLDEIYRENEVANNMGALSLALVTLSVLLLSAAGIYALMSFTVRQRRREIGIRSALGAQPLRVLTGIFGRALGQIGAGVVVGMSLAVLLARYFPIEQIGGWNVPGVIPLAALFMLGVGLLAAAGPARRGLKVDPIEELREG